MDTKYGSREIAVAAIRIAMTETRDKEKKMQEELREQGICAAGVDCGGEFQNSISKIIERAVVCAKREGIINDSHIEEGAVAGAAHEALMQIGNKAMGFNVGGKIGIARYGDHITVCVFFAIGLIHLNDISIGIGHRAL